MLDKMLWYPIICIVARFKEILKKKINILDTTIVTSLRLFDMYHSNYINSTLADRASLHGRELLFHLL